jgi:hypothetical protein
MVLGMMSDTMRSFAWLLGSVCIFTVTVLPFTIWFQGMHGVLELGAAALVCLFSGFIVLGVSLRSINTNQALQGMLLSMLFRLLPPLMMCMLLALRGSAADYFGFICYLLAIYMLTLAVETIISVRWIGTRT